MASAGVDVHTDADGTVRSSMRLLPDHGLATQCCVYADQAPIMTVSGPPGTHVAISVQDRSRVTRGELEFARALAIEAARYAAECAKYYVPDDTTRGDVPERVA